MKSQTPKVLHKVAGLPMLGHVIAGLKAAGVSRIVVETPEGSFGLLPRRLDCVAALTPGILIYETEAEGESYVAVDEGVLVKSGPDVRVSVRRIWVTLPRSFPLQHVFRQAHLALRC